MKYTFKPKTDMELSSYLQHIIDNISVRPYQNDNGCSYGSAGFMKFLKFSYKYYGTEYYSIISNGPTGNCQVGCIGYFNMFLDFLNSIENYEKDLFKHLGNRKEFKWYLSSVVLRRISSFGTEMLSKPLLMGDINQQHEKRANEWFDVGSLTPYLSTNGSKMTSFLINLGQVYSDGINYHKPHFWHTKNVDPWKLVVITEPDKEALKPVPSSIKNNDLQNKSAVSREYVPYPGRISVNTEL